MFTASGSNTLTGGYTEGTIKLDNTLEYNVATEPGQVGLYAGIDTGIQFDDYTVWRNDRPESLDHRWVSLAGQWTTDETAGQLEVTNPREAIVAVAMRRGARATYFKYEIDRKPGTGGGKYSWAGPAFGALREIRV